MNWQDETCPKCEFWVREIRRGIRSGPNGGASVSVSCSGNCFLLPDHPRTDDTNTCGRFDAKSRVKSKLRIVWNVLRS